MWNAPAYLLRVEQRWSMFSPQPPSRTRYLVARGETDTGAAVDLLNGAAFGQIERRPAGRYDRMRWRSYFGYVGSNGTREFRERLAAYLGDDWKLVQCRPGTTNERAPVLRQRGTPGGPN